MPDTAYPRREYLKRGPAPKVGLLNQPGVTEGIKKYFSPKAFLQRGFYPLFSKEAQGVDTPTIGATAVPKQLTRSMALPFMRRLSKYFKTASPYRRDIKHVRLAGGLIEKGKSAKDVDIVVQLKPTSFVKKSLATVEGEDALEAAIKSDAYWKGGLSDMSKMIEKKGIAKPGDSFLDFFVQYKDRNLLWD